MGNPCDVSDPPSDTPTIHRVCYDGIKWVDAWNVSLREAFADKTLHSVEFTDGRQVLRGELENFLCHT
jgi:hypothetical protein